jgi:hypothetical protein
VGKQVCIEHLETDETGLAGKWGKACAQGLGWLPALSCAHIFTCTYKHMQSEDQLALRVGNKSLKPL